MGWSRMMGTSPVLNLSIRLGNNILERVVVPHEGGDYCTHCIWCIGNQGVLLILSTTLCHPPAKSSYATLSHPDTDFSPVVLRRPTCGVRYTWRWQCCSSECKGYGETHPTAVFSLKIPHQKNKVNCLVIREEIDTLSMVLHRSKAGHAVQLAQVTFTYQNI